MMCRWFSSLLEPVHDLAAAWRKQRFTSTAAQTYTRVRAQRSAEKRCLQQAAVGSVNGFLMVMLLLTVGAVTPVFAEESRESGYVSPQTTNDGARLIFNWNSRSKVRFNPETKGNKVLLHFNAPVNLQWDRTLKALPSMLQEVESTNGGKTVVLTLSNPAEAKSFLVYGRDGIDVSRNGVDIRTKLGKPKSIGSMASHTKEKKKPHKKSGRKKTDTTSKSKTSTVVQPESNAIASLAALSPAAGTTEPVGNDTIEAIVAPDAETPLVTTTKETPPSMTGGETIVLPLLKDDPFVVFSQGKNLWLAADDTIKLTPELLKGENKSLSYAINNIPAQHGTILEIMLDKQVSPVIRQDKEGKITLLLSQAPVIPDKPLTPTLTSQEEKNSITIQAAKTGKIISASHPQTGEALYIVPVAGAGTGVETTRSFVEFSLPATAQGVVVQKTMDDVNITLAKEGIDISSSKGLAISAEFKQQLEELKVGSVARKIPPVLFPYARWKLDDPKKFVPLQKELVKTIYSSAPEEANKARLKLLQIFLSEGLFAEANGMANDILRNSYKFYSQNNVAAMRGAANFFRQRFSDAEKDFSSEELENNPEAKMWLELIAMADGKEASNFNFKAHYDNVITFYPPSLIQKIAVIAADKNVARKDFDTASAIFLALQKDGLDEPVAKYFDFMRAKILSETGNEEEAAKIWERQSADVSDRLIRARAEFSLVNMYLKEEKIPFEEAAKRLERLRIVWRGDSLELNVLTLLGNLYLEQKDYARALRAWRDIVTYYSEVPDAITTARKMQGVFVKLFNKGAANELPPLTALSLFYEFRDLVPTGSEGDLMIRNLSERLVKIDLLDRASQLLSHQIRNRLQGQERSRVGARLAEIYLMNRQPKQALEILKISGYGDLTPEVQLSRIRLTAQALAQQGQLDKAIEVLSSDTSPEGNLLRLSVYWTNWDWPNVVTMAEEILSNRNDPSAPLTLPESEVLLKLATAYVYEQDSGQIQYLRDYFTPLLKNNPNQESFLFITSESGSIDYGNLSNLDKDINTVKSFIDPSRKEAKGKSVSSTMNPAASDEPVKAVN